MAEPTLQQVFGANATQSATELIISKADLVSMGLSPAAANTAESLFVALLLKCGDYLKQLNQDLNSDIQVVIAQDATPFIISRNNAFYRQLTFSIGLQTIDINAGTIDPDNF